MVLQVHMVCEIPPYHNLDITHEVTVQVLVSSCDKLSEPHFFTYKPLQLKSGEMEDQPGGWSLLLLYKHCWLKGRLSFCSTSILNNYLIIKCALQVFVILNQSLFFHII